MANGEAMNSQEKRWYLARNDQKSGPFSDADVANFVKHGQLKEADLIWREGFLSWRRALTVFPELPPKVLAQPAPVRERVRPPAASQPVDKAPRQEHQRYPPRIAGGLTWKKALIALACAAAIGATAGYVFKYSVIHLQLGQDTGAARTSRAASTTGSCKSTSAFVFSSLRERAAVGIRDLGT